LIVVVMVGVVFVAVRTFHGNSETPDLEIIVIDIRPESDHYHVALMAENESGRLASRVRLHGELHVGGITEIAETTIPYIPGRSKAWTSLHFQHDPRARPLTVHTVHSER
jgi:uncharacterized protein (TIGR02588 family)